MLINMRAMTSTGVPSGTAVSISRGHSSAPTQNRTSTHRWAIPRSGRAGRTEGQTVGKGKAQPPSAGRPRRTHGQFPGGPMQLQPLMLDSPVRARCIPHTTNGPARPRQARDTADTPVGLPAVAVRSPIVAPVFAYERPATGRRAYTLGSSSLHLARTASISAITSVSGACCTLRRIWNRAAR